MKQIICYAAWDIFPFLQEERAKHLSYPGGQKTATDNVLNLLPVLL